MTASKTVPTIGDETTEDTSTTMKDETPDESRPSFTTYWKNTNQPGRKGSDESSTTTPSTKGTSSVRRRNFDKQTILSSESPENKTSSGGASPSKPRKSMSTLEKAKLRRAQVRRAQIQHRQRKAEYIKQLEFDVNHFREMIQLTEIENGELQRSNSAMNAKLTAMGIPPANRQAMPRTTNVKSPDTVSDAWIDQAAGVDTVTRQYEDAETMNQDPENDEEMFADIDVDDILVSLKKDDTLNTPIFSVRSNPNSTASSVPSPGEDDLSQLEEQMAINFILALERICWDHFFLGDYPSHSHYSDEAKGHTLMASSICMAHAPPDVYMGRKLISSASQCHNRRALGLDPTAPPVFFEWPSPRISLSSLHGLAASLNPGDLELTPVQAWFELASRYPKRVLLDPTKLELLRQELNGVVDCLDFGAVLERDSFESVVARVLGDGLDEAMAEASLES